MSKMSTKTVDSTSWQAHVFKDGCCERCGLSSYTIERLHLTFCAQSQDKEQPAQKCDHKFIDSRSCLKCGWTPTARDLATESPDKEP